MNELDMEFTFEATTPMLKRKSTKTATVIYEDGLFAKIGNEKYPILRSDDEFKTDYLHPMGKFKTRLYTKMRCTEVTRVHYTGLEPGMKIEGNIIEEIVDNVLTGVKQFRHEP